MLMTTRATNGASNESLPPSIPARPSSYIDEDEESGGIHHEFTLVSSEIAITGVSLVPENRPQNQEHASSKRILEEVNVQRAVMSSTDLLLVSPHQTKAASTLMVGASSSFSPSVLLSQRRQKRRNSARRQQQQSLLLCPLAPGAPPVHSFRRSSYGTKSSCSSTSSSMVTDEEEERSISTFKMPMLESFSCSNDDDDAMSFLDESYASLYDDHEHDEGKATIEEGDHEEETSNSSAAVENPLSSSTTTTHGGRADNSRPAIDEFESNARRDASGGPINRVSNRSNCSENGEQKHQSIAQRSIPRVIIGAELLSEQRRALSSPGRPSRERPVPSSLRNMIASSSDHTPRPPVPTTTLTPAHSSNELQPVLKTASIANMNRMKSDARWRSSSSDHSSSTVPIMNLSNHRGDPRWASSFSDHSVSSTVTRISTNNVKQQQPNRATTSATPHYRHSLA